MNHILRKKWLTLIILCLLSVLIYPSMVKGETFDTKAEAAIIVDANTGKILFAKDKDTPLPPASMTKMMTEYLTFEKISEGEITWDEEIFISDLVFEISADNRFSGIGLRKNVAYSVRELYEAMAINSDNATTIALAELISGDEGEFVKLMNKKGEEMQLPNFKFVNSTGLDNDTLNGNHPAGTDPDDSNLLSAESAALLAYHIVTDFPEALDISSIPVKKFDDQEIRNYNWMLKHDTSFLDQFYYEGLDGLKTGNTAQAGYTFTSTAERDGRRLITVVMNAESEAVRFQETAKLLDYGFNHFETVDLFKAGDQPEEDSTIPVVKGKQDTVEIALKDGFTQTIRRDTEEDYTVEYVIDETLLNDQGELEAPIEEGQVIGKAELIVADQTDYGYILEGMEMTSVDLVTIESVEKKNWFSLLLSNIGDFFAKIWESITGIFK